MTSALFFRWLAAHALLLALAAGASAQMGGADGVTAPGQAAGAPAGSYALSGFDNVNLYSGNLNFTLPLLQVGGRGAAKTSINLAINSTHWKVERDRSSIDNEYVSGGGLFCGVRRIEDPDECTTNNGGYGIILDGRPLNDPGSGSTILNYVAISDEEREGIRPGYGPGVVQGRGAQQGGVRSAYVKTVFRLFFTTSDGTEIELRDAARQGEPIVRRQVDTNPFQRGRVFVSSDGSSMSFISDTIIDDVGGGEVVTSPSGYLLLSDGTRCRVDGGLIMWLRDRNGNQISFAYGTNQTHEASYKQVTAITDSLSRTINITYANRESPEFVYDQISFSGFGGAARTIKVYKTKLQNVLHTGRALKTIDQLFPDVAQQPPNTTIYNPDGVVSRVVLPNDREYRFTYDEWKTLTRVELPTGGAVEYIYPTPVVGEQSSVQRGIKERRVFPQGTTGDTFESKQVYTKTYNTAGQTFPTTEVLVEQFDRGGAKLSSTKHFFYGQANVIGRQLYPNWRDGREFKTEHNATDGATLLVTEKDWRQRVTQLSWAASAELSPAVDVRMVETKTTLRDVSPNLVTKQSFRHDRFNNVIEMKEYDFGSGRPPTHPVRVSQTDYVVTANGIDYTGGNPESPEGWQCVVAHAYNPNCTYLRRLSKENRLYRVGADGAQTLVTKSNSDFDQFALTDRAGITGWTSPGAAGRGNATTTRSFFVTNGVAGSPVQSSNRFDIAGNIISTTDPRGHTSESDFVDAFSDGLNRNTFALISRTISADPDAGGPNAALTTHAVYDFHTGLVTSQRDQNGESIVYQYTDSLDRLTRVVRASGSTDQNQSTFEYSLDGRQITTTHDLHAFNDNLLVSQVLYDGLGREVESRTFEDGGYIATLKSYDGMGRVAGTTNPFRPSRDAAAWTTTEFDGLGRVAGVRMPGNALVATTYLGDAATTTDPAGKVKRTVTDALGRVVQVEEGPGTTEAALTQYRYDVLDNLTTVTKGSQNRYFMYDSLSRLIRAKYPEQDALSALDLLDPVTGNNRWSNSYTYDHNSNVATKTDARGATTTYTYDAINRITSKSYAGDADLTPDVAYTYDVATVPGSRSKGRLSSISAQLPAGGASTYLFANYDAMGRIKESRQTIDGQTYSMTYDYNAAGRMTSERYPSGRVVTTGYDAAGREASVSGGRSYVTAVTYAPNGAISELRLGNQLKEVTTRNNRLQTTQIELSNSGGASLFKLTYAYGSANNNGNVQSQTIALPGLTLTQSYTYDPLNRLREATEAGAAGWRLKFTYDQHGNRAVDTANTTPALVGPNPLIDADRNRITPRAGEQYVHDFAGNLTRDEAGHTYTYDAENRLVKFDNGATTYSYDGSGNRIKKVSGGAVTVYVYNVNKQLVAEYANSTPATQTSFVTSDMLGTTRVVTDANGGVKARHDYLPFGEEVGAGVGGRTVQQGYVADNVRQKFTGKERDFETGLDYFLSRHYASRYGRFISTDPLNIVGLQKSEKDRFADFIASPRNWNAYAYTNNNPLNSLDPDGLLTIIIPGTAWEAKHWNEAMRLYKKVWKLTGEKPIIFEWDGKNRHANREAAAKVLAKFINDAVANHHFAPGEKIFIVAHSHGGNIAFQVSQMSDRKIDVLITLGTPIRGDYKPNEDNIGLHLNVFSTEDMIQVNGGGIHGDPWEMGPAGREVNDARVKNLDATAYTSTGSIQSHSDLWQRAGTWNKVVVPALKDAGVIKK